jgi:ABC-2 type transport system ATP-binding protein
MAVIVTEGLTKYYGKNRGILDVSISVNEGEIYGFIGPNGAGKSTTIKTLLNFIFPTKGSARVLGLDCASESHQIKAQTGYVPSEIRYYEDLTVRELLDYAARFHKGGADTQEWIDRFELETKKKIGQLSSGNKKKVALASALQSRPKLLILDEPTNGLDPLMRQTLFDALREQQKRGCTVFLSSHNLDEVQTLCDRVAIIREGRIADVRELREMAAAQGKKVTAFGGRLPEKRDEALRIVSETADSVVFTWKSGDMRALLALLTAMEVKDFLVEDEKLSDIFMSYYN